MTEVLFFHLQRHTLEKVLPTLLQRCLDRGWRALVKASSEERVAALDGHLWTYADESFLPHGVADGAGAAADPVVLSVHDSNPNGAQVLFLVDGAQPPAEMGGYERVTLIFDGADDEAVAAARQVWRDVAGAGHAATYWQEGATGGWEKRG